METNLVKSNIYDINEIEKEETLNNFNFKCDVKNELDSFDSIKDDKGSQKVPIKRRYSRRNKLKDKKPKINPFKLEDLFHWLFKQQIDAMRPFVTDFDAFTNLANGLWHKYMIYTGSYFDLKKTTAEEVKREKYPLGWGVPLNPNRVLNTLNILPTENPKRASEENSDGRNGTVLRRPKKDSKAKIKNILKEKFNKKSFEVLSTNDDETDFKDDIKVDKHVMKEEMVDAISDTDESDISDDNDVNSAERREEKIMRVIMKKKIYDVQYTGSRCKLQRLYMENNLIILYYTLTLSRLGTENCCCLIDIWRLAKRGDIPFLKIGRILPDDKFLIKHTAFQSIILRDIMPSYNDLKHYAIAMAETLELEQLLRPYNNAIVRRHLHEHNLPITLESLINFIRIDIEGKLDKYYSVEKDSIIIDINGQWVRFKAHCQHILFPEVSSLGYIFMAIRILMRFDYGFEIEVSKLASELEISGLCGVTGSDDCDRLFIWSDWIKQERKRPTISTAENWIDFVKVRNAEEFLEKDVNSMLKEENTLRNSELFNRCGRFVRKYKKSTHEDVIKELLVPFEDLAATTSLDCQSTKEVKKQTDFRNSSIYYLSEAEDFKMSVLSKNKCKNGSDGWSVLNKLTDMVIKRPLGWRDLGLNNRRFPKGVFEELMVDDCMTEAEISLIEILTYNTGVSFDLFYDTVDSLAKIFKKE